MYDPFRVGRRRTGHSLFCRKPDCEFLLLRFFARGELLVRFDGRLRRRLSALHQFRFTCGPVVTSLLVLLSFLVVVMVVVVVVMLSPSINAGGILQSGEQYSGGYGPTNVKLLFGCKICTAHDAAV